MPKTKLRLTVGHIYRWEELSGKNLDQLSTEGMKDIGLLLYVMAGEPEGQKPHEFLQQYEISDLTALANEIKGAVQPDVLASVPKTGESRGTK